MIPALIAFAATVTGLTFTWWKLSEQRQERENRARIYMQLASRHEQNAHRTTGEKRHKHQRLAREYNHLAYLTLTERTYLRD